MRSRLSPLVAALLLGVSPAVVWAQGKIAPGLIPKVRRMHPVRSLTELATWFERKRRYDRAWEMIAFALAHSPNNARLLARAARLNKQLGDLATARVYARKALAQRPGDTRLKALLRSIEVPKPSSVTPAPEAEATAEEVEEAAEEAAELALEQKIHVLGLMRMLDSARTAYDLHHPKTPLEELDLEKLRESKLLPAEFDDPELEQVTLTDGVLSHDPAGALADLKEAVGGYHKALANVESWLTKGYPHEALRDLEKVKEGFGPTARYRSLHARATRELSPEDARAEAQEWPETTPGEVMEKALDLWKSDDRAGAEAALDRLLQTWPDTPHAPVATRLKRLVSRGMQLEFLYDFYDQRARSLAASATTTEEADSEEEVTGSSESPEE